MAFCGMLVSHMAVALVPAADPLGEDYRLWCSSPHISERARQAVTSDVSMRALFQFGRLAKILKAVFLAETGAAAARATQGSRRRPLATYNSQPPAAGQEVAKGAPQQAGEAHEQANAGALLQAEQEQLARAAAKAAKRQRQKLRKAAEAAAAAEAEQQAAAAEVPAGAAVGPPAPCSAVGGSPAAGVSAPAAAPGECELPAATPPPACPDAAAAAACDEAVQPAGSTPEGAVCPAASSSDQLEVLLAQLGAGDAELAAGAEEQAQGSGAGSSGACLLPSPLPAVPQRPSSAAQLDALLAQLGVAGGAQGSEFYSAPGRVSPSPGKAAAVAAGAAAYSAAPADDDDSLDALLAQLGVGSSAPDGDAAAVAAGCASCSPAAPAMAAHSPPDAAPATPTVSLDPALLASLECPLTLQTMQQPVVAADGNTYERSAIAGGRWGGMGLRSD